MCTLYSMYEYMQCTYIYGLSMGTICSYESKSVDDINMSELTLRKGYYYSKQRTNELLKTSGQSEGEVWVIPVMLLDYPVLLDYPEVKGSKATFTIGDYGLARKEIQEAINDTTKSTVGIY